MGQDDDETTSWRDELRAELAHELLVGALSAASLKEIEMPHVVVCRDTETGAVNYSGPFPDGLAALVFAEAESEVDLELNDGAPLQFSVSALYPATRPPREEPRRDTVS